MEDQVPFKVYMFWKDNEKPEVRRFGVEKTVVSSFHYLNAKIQDVYPGLKGKAYSVAWKDEDGDDVVISSDDEVMTALQVLGGDVIKLYVYYKGGEIKDDDIDIVITATTGNANAPGANTIHYGVMCDVCEAPVIGFRYKCTTCDDFDLCSRCEAAGRHPEHCMVRVPTPTMPRTLIKAAIKRSRHFLKTVAGAVGEDCPYKRHRRERSGERRHRGDHHGHHGPHGPHGPHGEQRDHHRRQRASWLDTFATYMNEFANLAGDIDLDSGKPKAPEPKPEGNAQEKPAESADAQKAASTSAQAPKQEATTSTQGGASNPQACPFTPANFNLKQIKDLLEYLGGDVSVFSQAPATNASAGASAPNNDVEMGQGDRKTSDASDVSVKTETSVSSENKESDRDASPEKAEGWTVINKEKDLMDTTASAPQEPAPIGFNLPEEFQERVKISEGALYPPLNVATAVLNPKEPEVKAQPAPEPEPEGQAQPVPPKPQEKPATAPPQPQPRPRHPKPHIEAAIKHMLAMGFTNEGEWLTQLLESKDGNIAAVLDLLTPVNPRK